jgi:hypothetical protein
MRLLVLGVVLATGLGLTATASGQGATRTIKGTIVDSANHKPLSQAVLYLGRWSTAQRTGGSGTFRLTVPIDPALLLVRRPGYVPAVDLVVEGDSGSELDLGAISMRKVKTDADRVDAQNADVSVYPELAQSITTKSIIGRDSSSLRTTCSAPAVACSRSSVKSQTFTSSVM